MNDILENACIFEREKQPAACRIGSKGDPIPHWRAEKCFFRCTCPRKKRIAIYFPADRRKNSAEGFFRNRREKHLIGRSTKPPGRGPRRFCVLFEREKREREDVLMKAGSLLPDTYIIADPHGGVMDKIRIFYEGIVNVWPQRKASQSSVIQR